MSFSSKEVEELRAVRSETPSPPTGAPPSSRPSLHNRPSLKLPNVDPELISFILDELIEKKPSVKFDDIGGQTQAKRALQEAVILPVIRPEVKRKACLAEFHLFFSCSPAFVRPFEEFFSSVRRATAKRCS